MEQQECLPSLYHYTSQQGLKRILGYSETPENKKKPSLSMTNILYMNDFREFTHAISLVISKLNDQINSSSEIKSQALSMGKSSEIKRVLEDFLKCPRTESYVFSLSESRNDLSQYRGYCPNEGGFCIEFDYNKLKEILKNLENNYQKNVRIKPCKYALSENNDDDINNLLDDLVSNFSDLQNFYARLAEISSFIKHKAFISEKEHRIIYVHPNECAKKIREGKSMLIPYVELVFDDNEQLPISQIFVGPTPHPKLAKLSVEYLLESTGYDVSDDLVKDSDIPYRSW